MHDLERDNRRMVKPARSPLESIITGSVLTLVFGALWLWKGEWWWAFPVFFAGVSPVLMGIRRLLGRKKELAKNQLELEAQQEKEILRAAFEQKGKLTAAGAALKTNLTIQAAQELLEKMTKNGHAAMKITNSGTIVFEFPEFLEASETNRLT
jgi:hypothetical protein